MLLGLFAQLCFFRACASAQSKHCLVNLYSSASAPQAQRAQRAQAQRALGLIDILLTCFAYRWLSPMWPFQAHIAFCFSDAETELMGYHRSEGKPNASVMDCGLEQNLELILKYQ